MSRSATIESRARCRQSRTERKGGQTCADLADILVGLYRLQAAEIGDERVEVGVDDVLVPIDQKARRQSFHSASIASAMVRDAERSHLPPRFLRSRRTAGIA